MIDADQLWQARAADVAATAERLGASLKRVTATELAGPCIVCGGRDRFSINRKQQVWHCRGCGKGGNVIALVQHIRGCDFREAVAFLAGGDAPASQARPRTTPTAAEPEDNVFVERLIADIVRGLVPPRETPGEQYFAEARKIDTDAIADVLKRTDAIGWDPSVLFREQGHALDGQRLGCIVGIMTDPVTAKLTGAISRTYIHEGCKLGKARTLGRPAGVVRLTPDDEVLGGLHLAEGIETALTAMSWGLRPMWATGSTALMSKFPVLSGVECLNLIVDHDQNGAGEKAAREAEARWWAAGCEVQLLRSDAPGDLNDVIKEAAK